MPWLRTTLYLWKCAFVGIVTGLAAAWLLTKNLWLDMRMPTGRVIPLFVAGAVILGVRAVQRSSPISRRPGGLSARALGWVTLLILVLTALFIGWGDWSALLVLPAVFVRDTLPGHLSLSVINSFLLGVLVLGVPVLFLAPGRHCHMDPSRLDQGGHDSR